MTSQMRRVKALWNVLSDAGREVAVVGWWATWPAESVRGAIVSDHTCYHFLFNAGASGSSDPIGVTHPPELMRRDRAARAPPGRSRARGARALRRRDARGVRAARSISRTTSATSSGRSPPRRATAQIGLAALADAPPGRALRLHRGRRTRRRISSATSSARSDLSGELAEQRRRYGHAVEEMYRYADEIVGAYLDALDADTTLVVLSDHGFELGVLHEDPSRARDLRRVSERFHRIEGILYLYGNRVRAGRRLDQPAILDIAPTVLALRGRAARRPTCRGACSPRRSSFRRAHGDTETRRELRDARSAAELPPRPRPTPTSRPRSSSTCARSATSTRARRRATATSRPSTSRSGTTRRPRALRGPRAREPRRREPARQPTPARSGRSDATTRRSRSSTARSSSSPPTPRRITTAAAIPRSAAIRKAPSHDYQTALRYDPDYEPSRSALARLGGGAAAARRAAHREREARRGARRAGAPGRACAATSRARPRSSTKPSASRPRFALVSHYRANVAYLTGDRAGAIKAAASAPSSSSPTIRCFATNLERLEAASMPGRPDTEGHRPDRADPYSGEYVDLRRSRVRDCRRPVWPVPR